MPYHRPVDAMAYPRFEGIRTFMRLPHLAEVERLGEADLAIVGVPFDTGAIHRVGARFGPAGIRNESMLLRPYHPELAVDAHADLWPGYYGGKDTHGTPFRRALEEGLIDPARSVQIGLRGPVHEADHVYAPGAGTPEVGGLTSVQALRLLRGLAGLDFVAFDLVEVMPAYDVGAVTQLLAANPAYEMIALAAVAKRGVA